MKSLLALFLAVATMAADPWPDAWQNLAQPAGTWVIQGGGSTATIDEHGVLHPGAQPLQLRIQELPGDHFEIIAEVRAPGAAERPVSINFGLPSVEGNPFGRGQVALYWYAGAHNHWLQWASAPDGTLTPERGQYGVVPLVANRLAWPPALRLRTETDLSSLPDARERWLSVKLTYQNRTVSLYLDDRLIRRYTYTDKVPETCMIRLTEGAELRRLASRTLEPAHPRFEPLAMDGYVNSDQRTLQADTTESITHEGIPFALSRAPIDLGPSRVRETMLNGAPPASGPNGRWPGALWHDPARLQIRLYGKHLRTIHLLAAASGAPYTTNRLTAQLYRPSAGHPVQVAADVPLFAEAVDGLPVSLADGTTGKLSLISIPLGGLLDRFSESDIIEIELTKEVVPYATYPDPIYYSHHAVGLPSGIAVYGITLDRGKVGVQLEADSFGHTWTAPAKPVYTVTLTPLDGPVSVDLTLEASPYANPQALRIQRQIAVGSEPVSVDFPLDVQAYGYHDLFLTVDDGVVSTTHTRSFAWLRENTRETEPWQQGHGMRFGFWDWGGAHMTPKGRERLELMYQVGARSSMTSFAEKLYDDDREWLAERNMHTPFMTGHMIRPPSFVKQHGDVTWDPTQPEAMVEAINQAIHKSPSSKPTPVSDPQVAMIFGEPLLGTVSYMSLPIYYNEPPYVLTEAEAEGMERMSTEFLLAAKAIRRDWPDAEILMPWGLPNFIIPFLRHRPDVTQELDGFAIDMAPFERMPEMQVGQVTLHNEMWQTQQEWLKHSPHPWPKLLTVEGPCIAPAHDAALTPEEEAAHNVRAILALSAYNVNQILGWPTPFHCGGFWGESHYGSGLCEPLPLGSAKPVLAAYATLTRQLSGMNFVKAIPTGSHSVFCFEFQHYRTGERCHVLWTLRGKRPVTIAGQGQAYDSMDNLVPSAPLVLSPLPVYVRGLEADPAIALGEPDHTDASPNDLLATNRASHLANLGDGSWRLDTTPQLEVEASHAETDKRFPGIFTASPVDGREGRNALAIDMPDDTNPDRGTMTTYSTLLPAAPITIPGRASHLGIWVRAESDWGRVIYSLRDATGERWLSVGKQGEWNCDDIHSWSRFCFDGWRYLRFPLPANAPVGRERMPGFTWWGNHGGDANGEVDLPLQLVAIVVERRHQVVYVNELIPANRTPVLLGDLYAEYADPADASPEVIALDALRLADRGAPALENPFADLLGSPLAKPDIERAVPPEHGYDGRRCVVHFAPVEGAVSYDLWVATYADGRGALKLGRAWKESGGTLAGLMANTDYYLFLTWTDSEGRISPPSPAYHLHLQDQFPLK